MLLVSGLVFFSIVGSQTRLHMLAATDLLCETKESRTQRETLEQLLTGSGQRAAHLTPKEFLIKAARLKIKIEIIKK